MAQRGVKALVIGMAVVIIVGFAVVVVTIVDRLANPHEPEVLGNVKVSVPAGCHLADAWSEEGRLYLRYDGTVGAEGKACGLVIVLEADSGREVARYGVDVQP